MALNEPASRRTSGGPAASSARARQPSRRRLELVERSRDAAREDPGRRHGDQERDSCHHDEPPHLVVDSIRDEPLGGAEPDHADDIVAREHRHRHEEEVLAERA